MLFDQLVEPGDPVVVESPSYDRTLLALGERGAERFAVPLQADGIDVGRARGGTRCRPASRSCSM